MRSWNGKRVDVCTGSCGDRTKASRNTHVQTRRVAIQDAREVELLHLLLEAAWETGVHAGATGEDNMLVELGADVDGGILNGLEEHFWVED